MGEYAANFLKCKAEQRLVPAVKEEQLKLRSRAMLLLLLAVTLVTGSCTKKTLTLNLLVWEGYADPLFVKAFEEQRHCKVSASYMGSSDELTTKLNGDRKSVV